MHHKEPLIKQAVSSTYLHIYWTTCCCPCTSHNLEVDQKKVYNGNSYYFYNSDLKYSHKFVPFCSNTNKSWPLLLQPPPRWGEAGHASSDAGAETSSLSPCPSAQGLGAGPALPPLPAASRASGASASWAPPTAARHGLHPRGSSTHLPPSSQQDRPQGKHHWRLTGQSSYPVHSVWT